MPLPFLLIAGRLASLYARVFPENPEWLDEEVAWQQDEDVAQAVSRFLDRVAQHRFPVDSEVIDIDAEAAEWALWNVPVIPLGFPVDYGDEWEYIREPAGLLVRLTYSHYLEPDVPAFLAEAYPGLPIPAGFDTAGLSQTLRRMALDGPLAALPDMVDMVREETGNPWLDCAYKSLA